MLIAYTEPADRAEALDRLLAVMERLDHLRATNAHHADLAAAEIEFRRLGRWFDDHQPGPRQQDTF